MQMWTNSGVNQASLKEANLRQIIRTLHFGKDHTRVSLARDMGLTQPAITKLVNALLNHELVTESDSVESAVGRKPVRLALNNEKFRVLCGRINRDYVSAAVFDMSGKNYYYASRHVEADKGARKALQILKKLLREGINSGSVPCLGIGMALPGPFDAKREKIALMSGFPGWDHIDLKKELSDSFGLPVFLEHDANCGALAELWHGELDDIDNLIYITDDRGIGAGLILDGELYKGCMGFAGELGHMSINCFGPRCECGNRGCLELYGSTVALEQTYRRMVFDAWQKGGESDAADTITAEEICALVRAGDETAAEAYERTVSYLAFGTASIVNTLNPQAVIYGDKIVDGGDLFLEVINRVLKRHLMPEVYENLVIGVSTVQKREQFKDPMLLGASVAVLEKLLEKPSDLFGD